MSNSGIFCIGKYFIFLCIYIFFSLEGLTHISDIKWNVIMREKDRDEYQWDSNNIQGLEVHDLALFTNLSWSLTNLEPFLAGGTIQPYMFNVVDYSVPLTLNLWWLLPPCSLWRVWVPVNPITFWMIQMMILKNRFKRN